MRGILFSNFASSEPLSDQLGRNLQFAFPVVAHTIFCIWLLLVSYFSLPLKVIAFAYFVEGLGGQITFLLAGCYAYISDNNTKKTRLIWLAILQTVVYLAGGLIQLPAGYKIGASGYIPVICLASSLHFVTNLYLVLPNVLIETVKGALDNFSLILRFLKIKSWDFYTIKSEYLLHA